MTIEAARTAGEPGSTLIVRNGTIVTLNERSDVYHGGHVVIRGDRIMSAGEGSAPEVGAARTIDASGLIVMPGLVDLHFHTAIERGGYSESLEVEEALFQHWYPMMRNLDAETAYAGALHSYVRAIRAGTTSVNDMFRHVESLARAASEVGIRATLSSLVARPEDGLDVLEDNRAAFHACAGEPDDRVQVAVGVEWIPLATADILRDAASMATELDTGLHIHLSESQQEVETCLQEFGARPVRVAYDHGLLGPSTVAAHCVWLTDEDIGMIAETGTHVSHNPAANSKLGEGIAPARKLLEAGVNVGLGHDSTEGNNTMDIFEVMRTGAYLQRAVHADPKLMPAAQMLRMATVNGARALGVEAGVIEPGHKADIILVETESDFFDTRMPAYRANVLPRLVFATNGGMVRTVIVDGRIVMEDRVMKTVDEMEAIERARDAVSRLVEGRRSRGTP
ncbi:MAG: amidohydrolase [bacterium]|nr:amidohydrolase [bacterium]MDE0290714.1 amidohydrolase [bacterium]MDE0439726.1 amidohydrolase [bacterium]